MYWIDKEFLLRISSSLDRFRETRPNQYTFRCPYCGDSKKSKSKARGSVYLRKNDYFYRCFNCGYGTTFANFLKYMSPTLFDEYCMQRWRNGENGFSCYPKPDLKKHYNFTAPVFKPKRLIDQIMDRVDTLEPAHPAVRYLSARQIPKEKFSWLYFVDDVSKIGSLSEEYKNGIQGKESRIVFPFFNRFGHLVGLTARSINNADGLRYLTVKVTDGLHVFGLEHIDRNKTVLITEGAMDSLFLDNAVSCSGSGLTEFASTLPKQNTILIWDNEPRNKEIVALMQKSVSNGFRVCVWPENVKGKDINEMVIRGVSRPEIHEIIKTSAVSGLQAEFKLKFWKKCETERDPGQQWRSKTLKSSGFPGIQ